jgi:hypothetical protein
MTAAPSRPGGEGALHPALYNAQALAGFPVPKIISSPRASGGFGLANRGGPREPSAHVQESLRGVARKIGVLRDSLEVGMDGVAQHGEGDRRFAFKQRAAQHLLEPDDGAGQRGLGDAALSSCPREIALLAERQKVPNLVHLRHDQMS